jgi:hypothetical protein
MLHIQVKEGTLMISLVIILLENHVTAHPCACYNNEQISPTKQTIEAYVIAVAEHFLSFIMEGILKQTPAWPFSCGQSIKNFHAISPLLTLNPMQNISVKMEKAIPWSPQLKMAERGSMSG